MNFDHNCKFKIHKRIGIKIRSKKDVTIINPGCNYPLTVNEKSKEFFKKYLCNSPKLITVSRLDVNEKSHQNIFYDNKNLLPKFPNLKYVSIGDGEEKRNLEKLKIELGLEKSRINF